MQYLTPYEIVLDGLLLCERTGKPYRSWQNIARLAQRWGYEKQEVGNKLVYLIPKSQITRHNEEVTKILKIKKYGK